MELPELVADRLGDEPATAAVDLGGGDAVYVTPERTLLYRSEGLLSDESVESFSHDVDRIDLRESRRKTTFVLADPERTREFTVPATAADEVLEAVLVGVLRHADVVGSDEAVRAVYRFSELTLVVTDARLLKHVGSAVWADDFEEYPFADATGLDYEEGTHSTQIVVEMDGRPHRIKTPPEDAAAVRRSVENALFSFHDVGTLDELDALLAPDDEEADAADPAPDDEGAFGIAGADAALGLDEKTTDGSQDDPADVDVDRLDATDVEPIRDEGDLRERVAALEAAVEHQTELLERQQETLERLVDELRRGR